MEVRAAGMLPEVVIRPARFSAWSEITLETGLAGNRCTALHMLTVIWLVPLGHPQSLSNPAAIDDVVLRGAGGGLV